MAELTFLPGELVYVSWRRYKAWPASIVGANDDFGTSYDIMYLGKERGYDGPMMETNVVSNRIKKSNDFNVKLKDMFTNMSIGKTIRIKWNKGFLAEYFLAEIKNYNSNSKKHTIYYFEDQIQESIDISQEILQIGKPTSNHYPISPEEYNRKRNISKTIKQKQKKRKKRKKEEQEDNEKKKKSNDIQRELTYSSQRNMDTNTNSSNNNNGSTRNSEESVAMTKNLDFKTWLKCRKTLWRGNRIKRKRISEDNNIVNNTEDDHLNSMAWKSLQSKLYPPGTVCYLIPKVKKELLWPCIVLDETNIEENSEVYSWFVDTILPKYNNAILVFCFGSHNFSSANNGDIGLQPWGNGNLHIEDTDERTKLRLCKRRVLIKQYQKAVKEATLENNKSIQNRVFGPSTKSTIYDDNKNNNNKMTTFELDDDTIDAKSLRCEICGSLYDDAMMLLCDRCPKAIHIYCSAYKLPDSFDITKDDHCCQFCLTPVVDNTNNNTNKSNNINNNKEKKTNKTIIEKNSIKNEQSKEDDGETTNNNTGNGNFNSGNNTLIQIDPNVNNIVIPPSIEPIQQQIRQHTLVDMKCSENNEFLYFSSTDRTWIKQAELSYDDIQLFYSSKHFKRVIIRGTRFGSDIEADDKTIQRECGKRYIKRKWRFLNGTYTGITQVINYFKPEEIKNFEIEANKLLQSVGSKQIKSTTTLTTSVDANTAAAAPAPLENILKRTKTLDENIHKKRVKLFLGYRYAYGAMMKENQQKKSRLYNDVDYMRLSPSLVMKLKDEISNRLKLVSSNDFINQAVLNYYIKAGSSLGVHQDDTYLFSRPIISIRLFSDSILSFGCKGMGMQETPYYFPIEQKVGTITIMEGLAANNMLHCIRSRDIKQKSLSIIFRQVTEKAIKDMHLLNLKRERCNMLKEDHLMRCITTDDTV